MNIAVAGTGYVGLSLAVLLARRNTVWAVDIIPEKVDMINRGQSPIRDKEIEEYLAGGKLSLTATTDGISAYRNADFVVVSTPTDYDPDRDYFNTSSVESVIAQVLEANPAAYIAVKSTVPIGFTRRMQEEYGTNHILFSPEFLREGRALYDNLYPSRIIVGANQEDPEAREHAAAFAEILQQGAKKENVDTLLMSSTEAEAVKLFANTYLALRVAYFNELDTYAEVKNLDAESIIRGVGLDPRIGLHYDNPSFGYGGYCLPKDTKQLLANYKGIPNDIMKAIVESNVTRKRFIAGQALQKAKKHAKRNGKASCTVGVYRLIMKTGSDNFRQSAIQDIIHILIEQNAEIVIYEPALTANDFMGCKVIRDFAEFTAKCDLILANRQTAELEECREKVYTRDLFAVD